MCDGMSALESPPPLPSWQVTLRSMHRIGLLRALSARRAAGMVDASPRAAVAPAQLVRVVHLYYAGDGDRVETLWRRQAERYLEVHARQDPHEVAAAIRHAVPDLEALDTQVTPEALVVVTRDDCVTISCFVRHARLPSRNRRTAVTSPHHIVGAANVLLARASQPRRFVALKSVGGRNAYIATQARHARLLWRLRLVAHADVSALWAFAAWDRGDGTAQLTS